MGSEGQFVKSDGRRTSPVSKRCSVTTQRQPLTRIPFDATEDGRWSSAAGAKSPTEFPVAVTKTDVNGPELPLVAGQNAAARPINAGIGALRGIWGSGVAAKRNEPDLAKSIQSAFPALLRPLSDFWSCRAAA